MTQSRQDNESDQPVTRYTRFVATTTERITYREWKELGEPESRSAVYSRTPAMFKSRRPKTLTRNRTKVENSQKPSLFPHR